MGIGGTEGAPQLTRVLGHPVAYVVTALVLVTLYGWTFFTNPGRAAPADDPAYTLWRTEALMVEDPDVVMQIEGPDGMLSTGYRVTTPVVAGLFRRVLGVHPLTPTIVLAVGCRVVIALLLAGLAYRYIRDPLAWHIVALGSGSVLLTPVFGGYTDNMIALSFATGALYLIEPMQTRWPARIAFTGLLTMTGVTHPTTFTIFCGVLALLVILRAVLDHRRDSSQLIAAGIAGVIVLAVWKIGIWGPAVELQEAALPPPAPVAFFRERLGDWLARIGIPSALLIASGAVGLWSRRRSQPGLSRLSVAWLLPLLGVLGVVTSLAYPYYRFMNATLAWVLLIGLGGYFALRFQWKKRWIVAVAGVAVALAIGSNFLNGMTSREWGDPTDASITPEEKRDLDALRSYLDDVEAERVIFVVDAATRTGVRLYGFVKRAGNVTRYGVPAGLQDRTSIYLGSNVSLLEGRSTPGTDDYHEVLSAATLAEIGSVDDQDVVVVPGVFNRTGPNHYLIGRPASRPVYVEDGRVAEGGQPVVIPEKGPLKVDSSGWLLILLGALVLLAPGFLFARVLLRDAPYAYAGFAVAIGVAVLSAMTIAVLAITRQPLTATVAWSSGLVCNAAAMGAWIRARSRPVAGPA